MDCRKCGAELPASASFCDICGTEVFRETYEDRASRESRQREVAKRRRIIVRVAVGVGILVLIIAAWEVFWYKDGTYYFFSDVGRVDSRIDPDEYSKLSVGLTYKQVTDEFGRGAKQLRWGNAFSGAYKCQWPGKYYGKEATMKSIVEVWFDQKTDKVYSFCEWNVLDGDEIYKNLTDNRKTVTKKSRDEIEVLKPGMSYEEVADFLGVEGVLTSSGSNANGYVTKDYEWHFFNGIDYGSKVVIQFDKGKVRDISVY